MKVVENFISINGEGIKAGTLSHFVRFKGCNVVCSYCDTMWANEKECDYIEYSPKEILEILKKEKIENVTLTGGEPLLQKEMKDLLNLLSEEGFFVEIETNGTIDIKEFSNIKNVSFTIDYKLPSSNVKLPMITNNYKYLTKNDAIKFVVMNEEDLHFSKRIIEEYNLIEKTNVIFSTVFKKISPEEVVNFMIKNKLNGARLGIQLHKVIWDEEKRGV